MVNKQSNFHKHNGTIQSWYNFTRCTVYHRTFDPPAHSNRLFRESTKLAKHILWCMEKLAAIITAPCHSCLQICDIMALYKCYLCCFVNSHNFTLHKHHISRSHASITSVRNSTFNNHLHNNTIMLHLLGKPNLPYPHVQHYKMPKVYSYQVLFCNMATLPQHDQNRL